MSDPRTPRQVADAGLFVLIACRCGHEEAMDPLMLEFIYGDDFDLVGSTAEISTTFRCKACGSHKPAVSIDHPEAPADFVVERTSRRAAGHRG